MRQHLFVWTVFAPKLCYEAVGAVVAAVVVVGSTAFLRLARRR